MRTRTAILLFFLLLGAYFLTPIRNRSEAEDAYAYAFEVEMAGPSRPHVHHMLYLPAMKSLYRTVQRLGYHGRSHALMVLVSAACGAGSVLLVGLLCRRLLCLSRQASVLTAGWFGAAYGFWRYACEAEIYAPATLIALLTVYFVGTGTTSAIRAAAAGIVAGLGILVHIMNALAALLIGAVLQMLRRRSGLTVLYLSTAFAVVGVVYSIAMPPSAQVACSGSAGWSAVGRLLAPTTYIRGSIGFTQAVVSGNFLFSVPIVREQLPRLFPHRALEEELKMGESLSTTLRLAGFASTAVLVVLSLWMVVTRVRISAKGSRGQRPNSTPGPRLGGLLAGLWFAAYAGVILVFEPGNPEMWIMGLPSLFLFLGWVLIEPVVQARGIRLPASFLAALVVHNFIAGMVPLAAEAGDYNADKAAWLVEHASAEDAILTAGSATFSRYLRYHAEAAVTALNELSPEEMEASLYAAERADGVVFALDDVFEQPRFRVVRFPGAYSNVLAFAEAHRDRFEPLGIAAPCVVYVLKEQSAPKTPPF